MALKSPKTILLILLTFLLFKVNAQDTIHKKQKIYIGVSFSSLHYHAYFPDASYTIPQKELFPYRYGLDIKVRLWPRIYLSTGFLIDVASYRENDNLFIGSSGNPVTVTSNKSSNRTVSFAIPIRLDYKLLRRAVTPFITAGILPSIYYGSKNTVDVVYSDGTATHTTTHSYFKRGAGDQTLTCGQLGFGVDANMNRFKLQVFPLYEFGLYTRYASIVYYHRIGGALSLCYKI